MKDKTFIFKLNRISTEQFATIENIYVEKEEIQLKAGVNYAINKENKIIGCFTQFQFMIKESPFIIINVKCDFIVKDSTWNSFIDNENTTINFPMAFLSHLAVITVGTTRGVLHAKTENTKFNRLFLPTINVNDFVKEDLSFPIKEESKN